MKVLLAPEAEADLQATLDFIAERNTDAALKLGEHVFAVLQKLAETEVDGPPHELSSGERVRSWLIPLRKQWRSWRMHGSQERLLRPVAMEATFGHIEGG